MKPYLKNQKHELLNSVILYVPFKNIDFERNVLWVSIGRILKVKRDNGETFRPKTYDVSVIGSAGHLLTNA